LLLLLTGRGITGGEDRGLRIGVDSDGSHDVVVLERCFY
jgi:hypothetical protein